MIESVRINYVWLRDKLVSMSDESNAIASRRGVRNASMDKQFVFWCKMIFLLHIHSSSSSCMGYGTDITTYPAGNINIRYPGTPLEIFCTAEGNLTWQDITFRVNGSDLDPKLVSKVNETTIRLYIKEPKPHRLTYYCSSKHSTKRVKCLNSVLVGEPPSEVTDFKCISRNLEMLNCSWSYPPTNTRITYNLTFFALGIPVEDCKVQRVGNTLFCVWETDTQPRYQQQAEEFVFNLTSQNVFGTLPQNITIDHFSIVKPDKPLNLKVVSKSQHSVQLFWEIPFNIADFLTVGIDHKIEYQISKQKYFHHVDASHLHRRRRNYTFNLTGLPYAHMSYEVRVYIKPKGASDEFWSDFSYEIFQTESDRPYRPPDTAPGAFIVSPYEYYRGINLYWNQLQEYEENGSNFTYRVLVTHGGKTDTLYPDKNISLSYVTISRATLGALQVEIQSQNIVGLSKNSSYLYIPSMSSMLKGPTSFTKMAFENGSYELSWDPPMTPNLIDNYTLFWCQYNYTHVCVGRMNFTDLPPNKSSYIIELPNEKKYQFAIAVNAGTRTSGMVWAKCDISQAGVVMYSFPVRLKYGVPGRTHVNISWSMECTLRDGIITGYNVTYCPVINDTSICDNKVLNQSVYIQNPKVTEMNVTNLLPHRTYRFDLALNTTYGLKVTNETAYVTTLADVPTEPVNVKISDIKNDSVVVSWDPPLRRNGNIVRYQVYYGNEVYNDTNLSFSDISRRKVTLRQLQGFTNYSVSIVACNTVDMSLCSNKSKAILVRTRIGPPSPLKAVFNYADETFSWNEPLQPAGIVDLYQVRRIRDKGEEIIYNTTDRYLKIRICEDVKKSETFEVRAVNIDDHPNHGAFALDSNVTLPVSNGALLFGGEWSEKSTIVCHTSNTFLMILIFIGLFILVIGLAIGSIKLYKKYRKMEDIKPVLPIGFGFPEKDMSKYSLGSWSGSNEPGKKSAADEALLLPNKVLNPGTGVKQEGSHDNTDSTTLSQTSLEHQEPEASTSDEGSTSSLHMDIESNKPGDNQDNGESNSSGIESSNNSPNIDQHNMFKKPSSSGYIQAVPVSSNGYVQSAPSHPVPIKSMPRNLPPLPASSSYVMAGLPNAPIFTTGVELPAPTQTGYVRPEDQPRHDINFPSPIMSFPTLGPSPTKGVGLDSLPQLLASSYIQLQSLEPRPTSLKPAIRNVVPLKPATTNGYVSPADVVVNKQFNIMSGGRLGEESAILDPTMSPDAYCRFSWSADPSNDNLRAILAEPTTPDTPSN